MRLSEVVKQLERAGIENARGEALILFRHYTSLPEYVLRLDDPEVSEEELLRAIERRTAREPLQYILGECPFFDEVYLVTPAVLIPRADTELLVETVIDVLSEGAHLLDLCTGSGCVGISSLLHTKNTKAALVDLSPDALAVAKENVAKYHLGERVELIEMDILRDFPEGEYDCIASNPPYIPETEWKTLAPEIFAEPKMAFVANEDGMAFYRAILANGRAHLRAGGCFAFEIGYNQEKKIKTLAREFGLFAEVRHDLGGNPRVAYIH